MILFFLVFGFGIGQLGTGGFYQRCEVVVVVDIVDIETGLGTVVGWTHIFGTEQLAAAIGGFHIKAVVADEGKDLAIAVETIVAEHFAGSNLSGAAALVDDILYKIRIACHNYLCCLGCKCTNFDGTGKK